MKRGMEPFLVLNRTISSKSVHSQMESIDTGSAPWHHYSIGQHFALTEKKIDSSVKSTHTPYFHLARKMTWPLQTSLTESPNKPTQWQKQRKETAKIVWERKEKS